ncbi:MAG: efflux RND transporter permease subunit [Chryseolinea sp.]
MMIEKIISWSMHNRFFVWLGILLIIVGGVFAVLTTPVDAIPDLSENQVIIYTEWMGRNPKIIEDQVTYPLVSNLQGLPEIKSIRAASMFGMSFVFVIFNDDVDIYWARSRVLERLNYAQKFLPPGLTPSLGPDGTGVGHVFWYTLDAPGYNLGELRALQDWYVKFALQKVEGVSEVASFGGFQKQYQVTIDPYKLVYFNVPLMDVTKAITGNNRDVGGSIFEMNSTSYMIRGLGYITSIDDIKNISLGTYKSIPVKISDVATVQMSSDLRLGITEQNGDGEVVGGIVVMRYGENAKEVIDRIKERIVDVETGLPSGVKFKVAYDRSDLIEAAVATLSEALWEEILIVSIVVMIFIFHFRSALVAIITIPLSILIAFMIIRFAGISLNIMSLGGVALAIGDLVDAGIVMTENAYRQLTQAVIKPQSDQ